MIHYHMNIPENLLAHVFLLLIMHIHISECDSLRLFILANDVCKEKIFCQGHRNRTVMYYIRVMFIIYEKMHKMIHQISLPSVISV